MEEVVYKLDKSAGPSSENASAVKQRNAPRVPQKHFKTTRTALQGNIQRPGTTNKLLDEINSSNSDEDCVVEEEAALRGVGKVENEDEGPLDLDMDCTGFSDEDEYPSDINSYHDYSGAEENDALHMQVNHEDPDTDSDHPSDASDEKPAVRHMLRRSVRASRNPYRGRGRKRGSFIPTHSADPKGGLEDGWSEDPSLPILHPFTGTPGLTVPCPTTPLEFFQLFFPIEILIYITKETNDYAMYVRNEMGEESKYYWSGCSADDIAIYLGIMMWTGIVRMPDLRMFWAKNETSYVPGIASSMPRTKFETINKYFHAFNRRAIPKNNCDNLILIRPLMDFFRDKCESLYVPQQHLSLGEGMLKWKGRLNIKMYNPMKPTKSDIKIYFLCEAQTGIVLNFSIYRGVTVPLRDVVFKLMNKYLHQGYHVFMDNYYNSVALTEELYANGTHCSGTLLVNRGAPQSLRDIVKNRTLKRGEMAFRRRNNTFVICWQDVRMVTLITNVFNNATDKFTPTRKVKHDDSIHFEQVDMQRPVVVKQYINYMGGVHLFDQQVNCYAFARRTNHWTKKAIMYLIQLALLNAFKLYQQFYKGPRKLTHRQFHCHIADKFLYFNKQEWPASGTVLHHAPDLPVDQRADGPPRLAFAHPSAGPSTGSSAGPPTGTSAGPSTGTSSHSSTDDVDDPRPYQGRRRTYIVDPAERLLPGNHTREKVSKGAKQRRCRVCYKNGLRFDTSYICGLCEVPLCLTRGCFEKYHREHKYWDSPPPHSSKIGRKRKRKDFKCHSCGDEFCDELHLQQHMLKHNDQMIVVQNSSSNKEDVKMIALESVPDVDPLLIEDKIPSVVKEEVPHSTFLEETQCICSRTDFIGNECSVKNENKIDIEEIQENNCSG